MSTDTIRADKALIEKLGGPTKVCELLNYDKGRGGVQRVQNWMRRGIPFKVKVERPDVFPIGPPDAGATGSPVERCSVPTP